MASMSSKSKSDVIQTVGAHRLAKFGVLAAITAGVVNVLILFISLAVGEFPAEFVGGAFGPLAVGPVVMNSAVAAIGATLVFAVVTRYAARSARTFTLIAIELGTPIVRFAQIEPCSFQSKRVQIK